MRCTMFPAQVKDKVEDVTAVMHRQMRNIQTVQTFEKIPKFSTSRSRRFPDRVRWRDEKRKRCAGSEEHRLAAKIALEKHTQAVLNSADEGKDNRANRRRLRMLVSTSTFRSLMLGRSEEMLTTSWTWGTACHPTCRQEEDLKTEWIYRSWHGVKDSEDAHLDQIQWKEYQPSR